MYQEIHTDDIVSRAQAYEITDLLQHYSGCRRADGHVCHEQFTDCVMPGFGEDLMVVAPTADGDYEWVHFGREIVRYIGATRLGERISSLRPQLARFTRQCLAQADAENRALYTVHRSKGIVRVAMWERLILPTEAPDGSRRFVVFTRPLQFREDLLNAVLRTSPCGIVALRVVRNGAGEVTRTFVMMANPRAAELTAQNGVTLVDREAREALPFLADETVWNRCLIAIGHQRTDSFETALAHAGGRRWLQVSAAPLGDGLLLTLSDITELTVANETLRQRAATLALEIGLERASRRALSEEIGQREEREKELRRLAETDPLTALLNRRSFSERATAAIDRCLTGGGELALIIVDLDHFKQINDSHGHPAGDAAIRAVADLLLGLFRGEGCLVGRFGGEEFAVLVPGPAGEAIEQARQILHALQARPLPVSETLDLMVTASCGVAAWRQGETLASLTNRADQALYRAKSEGRARFIVAGDTGFASAA